MDRCPMCDSTWSELYETCSNSYCDYDGGAARRRRMRREDMEEMRRMVEENDEQDMK